MPALQVSGSLTHGCDVVTTLGMIVHSSRAMEEIQCEGRGRRH